MLVVGGGDSALEAANAIADEPGTHGDTSYRSSALRPLQAEEPARIEANAKSGRVRVLLNSNVTCIDTETVEIAHKLDDGLRGIEIANDAVIICAGGILPSAFLKRIGVDIETKHGTH